MLPDQEQKENIQQPQQDPTRIRAGRMNSAKPWHFGKLISTILLKIFGFLLLLYIIFTFVFQWVRYEETKMTPAVKPGDLLLVDKLNKVSQVRDLVALQTKDQMLIRRVIAVGGDRVQITDQGVLVNGVLQSEPYAIGETNLYKDGFTGEVVLAADEVFVLADVREDALDSRVFGPIRISDLIGRVAFFVRRRNF